LFGDPRASLLAIIFVKVAEKSLRKIVMTLTLELKPELEACLIAQAAKQGVSVEKILENFIELLTATSDRSNRAVLPAPDRAEQFGHWAKGHAFNAPPLSDRAISRDRIYTREDEML
jgi:hypothetical protein